MKPSETAVGALQFEGKCSDIVFLAYSVSDMSDMS